VPVGGQLASCCGYRRTGVLSPSRSQVVTISPGSVSACGEARIPGVQVSGAALAEIGQAIAPQRALTAAVVLVEALWP
jgi:hypothetical protein